MSSKVVATHQSHEPTPYLDGVDALTREIINDCAGLIQTTLDSLRARYGDSLGRDGIESDRKLQGIFKRIQWSMLEQSRLQVLQEKVQKSTQRLSLLTALAIRYVHENFYLRGSLY